MSDARSVGSHSPSPPRNRPATSASTRTSRSSVPSLSASPSQQGRDGSISPRARRLQHAQSPGGSLQSAMRADARMSQQQAAAVRRGTLQDETAFDGRARTPPRRSMGRGGRGGRMPMQRAGSGRSRQDPFERASSEGGAGLRQRPTTTGVGHRHSTGTSTPAAAWAAAPAPRRRAVTRRNLTLVTTGLEAEQVGGGEEISPTWSVGAASAGALSPGRSRTGPASTLLVARSSSGRARGGSGDWSRRSPTRRSEGGGSARSSGSPTPPDSPSSSKHSSPQGSPRARRVSPRPRGDSMDSQSTHGEAAEAQEAAAVAAAARVANTHIFSFDTAPPRARALSTGDYDDAEEKAKVVDAAAPSAAQVRAATLRAATQVLDPHVSGAAFAADATSGEREEANQGWAKALHEITDGKGKSYYATDAHIRAATMGKQPSEEAKDDSHFPRIPSAVLPGGDESLAGAPVRKRSISLNGLDDANQMLWQPTMMPSWRAESLPPEGRSIEDSYAGATMVLTERLMELLAATRFTEGVNRHVDRIIRARPANIEKARFCAICLRYLKEQRLPRLLIDQFERRLRDCCDNQELRVAKEISAARQIPDEEFEQILSRSVRDIAYEKNAALVIKNKPLSLESVATFCALLLNLSGFSQGEQSQLKTVFHATFLSACVAEQVTQEKAFATAEAILNSGEVDVMQSPALEAALRKAWSIEGTYASEQLASDFKVALQAQVLVAQQAAILQEIVGEKPEQVELVQFYAICLIYVLRNDLGLLRRALVEQFVQALSVGRTEEEGLLLADVVGFPKNIIAPFLSMLQRVARPRFEALQQELFDASATFTGANLYMPRTDVTPESQKVSIVIRQELLRAMSPEQVAAYFMQLLQANIFEDKSEALRKSILREFVQTFKMPLNYIDPETGFSFLQAAAQFCDNGVLTMLLIEMNRSLAVFGELYLHCDRFAYLCSMGGTEYLVNRVVNGMTLLDWLRDHNKELSDKGMVIDVSADAKARQSEPSPTEIKLFPGVTARTVEQQLAFLKSKSRRVILQRGMGSSMLTVRAPDITDTMPDDRELSWEDLMDGGQYFAKRGAHYTNLHAGENGQRLFVTKPDQTSMQGFRSLSQRGRAGRVERTLSDPPPMNPRDPDDLTGAAAQITAVRGAVDATGAATAAVAQDVGASGSAFIEEYMCYG